MRDTRTKIHIGKASRVQLSLESLPGVIQRFSGFLHLVGPRVGDVLWLAYPGFFEQQCGQLAVAIQKRRYPFRDSGLRTIEGASKLPERHALGRMDAQCSGCPPVAVEI